MLSYSLVLFAVTCAALVSDGHPLKARQAAAVDDTFNIYAYGEGISGFPLFYADGKAQIGNAALSTAKVAQPVYFTISEASRNVWIAHPNTTGTNPDDAAFQTAALSLLGADSTDGTVELKQPTKELISSNEANIFDFYGDYVLTTTGNINFYAVRTDAEGVYSLIWSKAASEHIPVILRTIAPVTDGLF
ncbi:hypothetical protein PHISCL_05354 [Aspergillus sclerotialis]|uniref:Uncharacterized protein n=1 Tax=Aspergillus sclerotialis TaxID=2070753 RepID=A0A3A2ZIE9_9EURO|nr:hypothetical protein PHISCL_05354 [Aspergillus sclerotialis]